MQQLRATTESLTFPPLEKVNMDNKVKTNCYGIVLILLAICKRSLYLQSAKRNV